MRLRSVDLLMPQAGVAAEFLENKWRLVPAGSAGATKFFRGTGDHPYIFSIAERAAPGVAAVTFAGSPGEIGEAGARAERARVPVQAVAAFDVPGGGAGFVVEGPEGQIYRLISEAERPRFLQGRDTHDVPIQITHAVINAVDREKSERFAVDVLGFRVSDRTRHMTFVRCNRKHHCVAYAHSDFSSFNHVAFEMRDIDAVMRGFGRMRDAGIGSVWGPGRHGPGNNVFGYFIAPFGGVIEYTAEVSEIGDDYKVGGPEDWKWPEGRIDHWGVTVKDVARISAAERLYRFVPFASSMGPR
jgi:catechol 2,3-dioxygenase-like lactoylglutathione lyase family enzyme